MKVLTHAAIILIAGLTLSACESAMHDDKMMDDGKKMEDTKKMDDGKMMDDGKKK
jgi:hypothetical protein